MPLTPMPVLPNFKYRAPDFQAKQQQRDLMAAGALAALASAQQPVPPMPQPPAGAGMAGGMGMGAPAAGPAALAPPPPGLMPGGMGAPGMGMGGPAPAPMGAQASGPTPITDSFFPPSGSAPAPAPAPQQFAWGGQVAGEFDLADAAPPSSHGGIASGGKGKQPKAPEPEELPPGVIPAHVLVEAAIRAEQGEEIDIEAYRGRATGMGEDELGPAGATTDAPPEFVQFLETATGKDPVTQDLVQQYQNDPTSAGELWEMVLEIASDPETVKQLPPVLRQMARGEAEAA